MSALIIIIIIIIIIITIIIIIIIIMIIIMILCRFVLGLGYYGIHTTALDTFCVCVG